MLLAITEELGRFETFFSEVVYPVWPLWLAGFLIALGAAGYIAYQRGFHRRAVSHPVLTGVTAAVILAIAAPVGWYTISPLFERNTVCEESPIPGADSGSEKCDGVAFAANAPATAKPTRAPRSSASPAGTPTATTAAPNSVPGTATQGPTATTASAGAPATTAGPTNPPEVAAAPTTAPTPAPAPTPVPTDAPFVPHEVARGVFVSADDFHFTNGDALLIETSPGAYIVRFENFSAQNGPGVHVLLSTTNAYNAEALELGPLKGTDGAFNYDVPPGTDVSQFQSVIIWCKPFNVLFGHAEFSPPLS